MVVEQAQARTSSRRSDARPPARVSADGGARLRSRPRVLVIAEGGILRDGLCALLTASGEFELIGAEPTLAAAQRDAASLRATVVLIELTRGTPAGSEAVASLKAMRPELRVLILTSRDEDHVIDAALRLGADGYVLKNDGCAELFAAVRNLAAGRQYVSTAARERIARRSSGGDGTLAQAVDLSERERQVMRLIAAGHRTREIAQMLSLSHKTIEKHRTTLMRKLGLRNASAVAAYAISHRIGEE